MSDPIDMESLTTLTQLRSTSNPSPQTIARRVNIHQHSERADRYPQSQLGRGNFDRSQTTKGALSAQRSILLRLVNIICISRSNLWEWLDRYFRLLTTYFNKSLEDTSIVIENKYHLFEVNFCKNSSIERIELWHHSEPILQL